MLTHVAANQMAADRSGNLLEVDESTAPTADGLASHVGFTDLGGIDHLFRDPVESLAHAVSMPLDRATSATPGPWGGLRPGYLQHAAVVLKADGAQLVEGSLAGVHGVAGSSLADRVAKLLERGRVALSVPLKGR